MQRRPLIAGNWKMNGSLPFLEDFIQKLVPAASQLSRVDFAIFPPFIFLPMIQKMLKDSSIAWGAQDVSEKKPGAYTGDISSDMLKEFNCRYVIVGHSERRQYHHETNELVAAKAARALETGLTPIVCVGETLPERETNQAFEVIQRQLEPVIEACQFSLKNLMIAYEPVWAIGTGKSATPHQAQQIHEEIRNQLKKVDEQLAMKMLILYGGSVKPDNAKALFEMADIDGALVGGASLQADQFLEIGKLCSKSF